MSKKGFDREVNTWNSLYSNGASGQKRYAIFQKNAAQRTIRRMDICLRLLDPKPGMKILDVGCGSGIFSQKITDKDAYWYGADISFKMLIHGKSNMKGNATRLKEWVNGSADRIPFRDSVFDAVACIGVLNFYKKGMMSDFLGEIGRVLRPGGAVILTSLRLDILTWFRSRLYPTIPLPFSSPGPLHPMHYRTILDTVDPAMFECVEMIHVKKYLYLPHYTIFKIIKK